ncbi:hypothetical protein GCM10007981_06520 [Thermocladium modestius]|uniref:DUF211 domain-containing protein n=1 Tax=Thermocladium modestius TaxID=62609 RepID=A0A830GSA2_9CREN|nr:DUF211 domain-containing protein [Thermocladium modestius]GGP20042.1 hypothetical protein GCM10007981_06520 [Thermocladium modestius]
MSNIRRLILDVDVPSSAHLMDLAQTLTEVAGVKAVNITVTDTDVDVLGLLIVVDGVGIDYKALEESITSMGGAIRSIDQVIAGEYVLDLDAKKLKDVGD